MRITPDMRPPFPTNLPFSRMNHSPIQPSEKDSNYQIIAIDALSFPQNQFSDDSVLREINKALAGFQLCHTSKGIASGKWGCGVYGGDASLKSLIQWIAASIAGKPVGCECI